VTWLPLELLGAEGGIPPQFAGFLMSVAGMVMGTLISQKHSVLNVDKFYSFALKLFKRTASACTADI